MNWSELEIATLKTLWTAGYSGTEISHRLGNDRTRNSVIGQVHRLGLDGRKVEERTTPKPFRRRFAKPSTPVPLPKPKPETKDGRKRNGTSYSVIANARARAKPIEAPPRPRGDKPKLIDLGARDCRWPYGDPQHRDFHFCGADTGDIERPYCPAHCREAYEPLRSRSAWRAE